MLEVAPGLGRIGDEGDQLVPAAAFNRQLAQQLLSKLVSIENLLLRDFHGEALFEKGSDLALALS
jgi:hypothetical protein